MNDDERARLLSEIDATACLAERPQRPANWRGQAQTLARLAEVFALAPEQLGQCLAESAMAMTQAHAAGISLDEPEATPRVFRWVATAGSYTDYLGQTMPWDFSPCGEVIRRDTAILMHDMRRLYAYVDGLPLPPHEVLLVPFHRNNAPIGTVWVVRHDDDRPFDLEDLRVVQTLTRFAGAAVDNIRTVQDLARNSALQAAELAHRLRQDAHKDRFIAVLAHEMRTPLTAIGLGLQIIKTSSDPAQKEAAIATMERQTGQLTTLVRDMTDVVAIREGKLALFLTPVVLQEPVTAAAEACRELALAKQHQLLVDLPAAPAIVHGDLVRLTQIVTNLLTNAIRYTPHRGRIDVSLTYKDTVHCLSVRDTGIGMSPGDIARAFEMYAQLPAPHEADDAGLGIGLALVKQLVDLHSGTVAVDSAGHGLGSTFTVCLPRVRSDEEGEELTHTSVAPTPRP
ncbi:ATP-binding protein [Lysobacter soli]|uniref:GAF domain-containing sensor histidine kinase n=1 Tax=Lysobacter soli TaxID=453783 RepID=UPI0037CBC616